MAEIKKEVEFKVEITVHCYECGNDLEVIEERVDSWGDVTAAVKPCNCHRDDKEK